MASFPILTALISQCIASLAIYQKRFPGSAVSSGSFATHSSASTLVQTASPGAHEVVTFYPSRILDVQLWTITAPTTIFSTEKIYPSGYEWIPSPNPQNVAPIVPTDAPYPTPGSLSISFPLETSTGALSTILVGTSVLGTGVLGTWICEFISSDFTHYNCVEYIRCR